MCNGRLRGPSIAGLLIGSLLATSATGAECAGDPPPFTVESGLFDASKTNDLGLATAPGTETITLHRPRAGGNTFNHGVVLFPFQGHLYAQWQTSAKDEDSLDTHVVYSTSADGSSWTPPAVLATSPADGYRTSGGWWSNGDTLIAYINEWPHGAGGVAEGFTSFSSSEDGRNWSDLEPVVTHEGDRIAGVFEQDPRSLPDGRIIGAFHMQPGLIVSPYYTDDPLGVSGWTMGAMPNLPHRDAAISREIEPSWFLRSDGAIVMVFRDQASTFLKLASVSCDQGETWSTPTLTDMPDARTKQSAGNLPDGTAYLIGNPVPGRERYPLVVTISQSGRHFDRAFLLRPGGSDVPAVAFPGRYKRPGYSYTKSVTWKGHLYAAYATGKEDVELTRVPIASLTFD